MIPQVLKWFCSLFNPIKNRRQGVSKCSCWRAFLIWRMGAHQETRLLQPAAARAGRATAPRPRSCSRAHMCSAAVPCEAMPCCAILCHAIPCHAMPCCAVPCRALAATPVPPHAGSHTGQHLGRGGPAQGALDLWPCPSELQDGVGPGELGVNPHRGTLELHVSSGPPAPDVQLEVISQDC